MRRHLAIYFDNLADKILTGEKTVDFRFSKAKVAPYLMAGKGEIVLVKNTGGKVIGQAEIDNVLFYDNIFPVKIKQIKDDYLKRANITDDTFNRMKKGRKYLSIIFFVNPQRFIAPLMILKHDRRGWATFVG